MVDAAMKMAHKPSTDPYLRVLCLDGGGVRGLSSLYILERLLYRMKPENDPKKRLKPCEVFDVIVGTSTGGLIAIMLGILEMDVKSCIETYLTLAHEIFTPRRRTKLGGALVHKILGSATFSARKLERAIKKVIRENHPQTRASSAGRPGEASERDSVLENMPMLKSGRECKVFVCTMLENGSAYRVRNYPSKHEPGLPMAVWEAARATTAAPTFFDPLRFGNTTTLRDGALLNNNPIMEVMRELEAEFGCRDSDISCIVSIGTGISETDFFRDNLVSVAKACGKIATDTREVEALFRSIYARPGKPLHERYFRLEVDQGLQNAGMEEWKRMQIIWSVTTAYLNNPIRQDALGNCAALLLGAALRPGFNALDSMPDPPDPRQVEFVIHDHEFLGLQTTDAFLGRDAELEWLDKTLRVDRSPEHAERDGTNSPVIAALTGLGGSGKTQVMLRYVETHADDYSAIFWIDAKSEHTVRSSFNHIARRLHIGSVARIQRKEGQESSALIRAVETDDVNAFKVWIRMRRRPWLLLFDNLTDDMLVNSITQFIPSCGPAPGRVIISSRRRLARRSWNRKVISGLNSTAAARELLFHYVDQKQPHSATDIADANRIVNELGRSPLSICLAGSYINVVGNLRQYLAYYDKMKRELLKKTLNASKLEGHYPVSVFVTWKTTLDILPEPAQRLYYLFCAMDRTSLVLDLLRRACSPKHRWGPDGELAVISPTDTGVPSWLLAMCLNPAGEWDEFAVLEHIYSLESLFLVRRESVEGDWMYQGRVVKKFGAGTDAVLVKMEHYVQEIGGLMLEDEVMAEYAAAAMCTAIHALEDDAAKSMRQRENDLNAGDWFPVLMPTGGMVNDTHELMFTLEECFGHIRRACECFPGLADAFETDGRPNSLSHIIDGSNEMPPPVLCFSVLSGICLGGRSPIKACATLSQLASAISYASALLPDHLQGPWNVKELDSFWIRFASECLLVEFWLWARKCWVDGTSLALRDRKPGDHSYKSVRLRLAGEASYLPRLQLIVAALVLLYESACFVPESPLSAPVSGTSTGPSTHGRLSALYWESMKHLLHVMITDGLELQRWLMTPIARAPYHREFFYMDAPWFLPIRDDMDSFRLEDLISRFRQTALFEHIWPGVMARAIDRWGANKPPPELRSEGSQANALATIR